jgi:hypothetical protein
VLGESPKWVLGGQRRLRSVSDSAVTPTADLAEKSLKSLEKLLPFVPV